MECISKVCFKEAVFPLLARMRYGLFYNMPLVSYPFNQFEVQKNM